MFIESLRRNWPLLHSRSFLPTFVTSHGSLPRARPSLYLWRILMKYRDALNFFTRMVFLIISAANLYQINHLIIHDPLTYLAIPHINVLCPLVIFVILSEMNYTLAVTMNRNWIMYDTKYLNQSFQPQRIFSTTKLLLMPSHVLRLCHWKSNCILQFCLPTNDALSYYA